MSSLVVESIGIFCSSSQENEKKEKKIFKNTIHGYLFYFFVHCFENDLF